MTQSDANSPPSGGAEAAYRVLARKYRPQHFGDLIGQQPMVTTLTNAFRSGRIAQAYMLTGVRGVGKTTTARILARALNYSADGADAPTIDVETEGEHCRAIMEGRHVDVIEMDAASHTGIDDIRDIIESAQYAPAIARYKVYIIDEVHMLSRNAFNGLLKTLEEPPPHLKFIFATTEIRKVPVTVLSRCQRFDLRRIDGSAMVGHLEKIAGAEGIEASADALSLIARAAEGSVRDALSILDQAIAHSAGAIEVEAVRDMLGLADRARIIDLFNHVMSGNVGAALEEIKDQYDTGADPAAAMTDLADFIHYVTRLKYVPQAADDAALSQTERERGAEFAKTLSVKALGRAWQILIKGIGEIEGSERPLAAADMVLVRLAHAATLPTPDELIRQITDGTGEKGGAVAARPASPGAGAGTAMPSGNGAPASAQGNGGAQATAPTNGNGGMQPQASIAARAAPRPAEPQTMQQTMPVPADEPAETRVLATFEELVLLAEDKRDIKLRTLLRKNVRVVSFSDGRMEINLAGNPPREFVSELSRKLLAWTGRRWTVAVSSEGGQPSLEEQEAAERQDLEIAARDDPAVAAILREFPGAKIVNVAVRAPEQSETGEAIDDPPGGDSDFDDHF